MSLRGGRRGHVDTSLGVITERSFHETVTSSRTSASLLRTSSGSDWKEGTLRERCESSAWREGERARGRVRRRLPAEEVGVLGVSDETRPHHDGLEALPVDGPQLDVGQRCRPMV